MSRTPRLIRYAALWLAVVIGAGSLTWLAIGRAGRAADLFSAAGSTGAAPSRTTAPTTSTTLGTVAVPTSPAIGTVPSTSAVATSVGTLTPPPPATTRVVPTTPRGTVPVPRTTAPASPPPPPPPVQPAPVTVERGVTTAGGRVVAACTDSRLEFRSAVPTEGWSVDQPRWEQGRLEVTFGAPDGLDDIEVKLTCVAGVPTFTVE